MDLYSAIVFVVFASLFAICLLPSRPFRGPSSVEDSIDEMDDWALAGGHDLAADGTPLNQSRTVAENALLDTRNYSPSMELAE